MLGRSAHVHYRPIRQYPCAGGLGFSRACFTGGRLVHRNGSGCRLECKYVVDGTPEGYGAAAFQLPVVFGREGWSPSADQTLDREAYAGRRSFSVGGHGPPVDSWSDKSVERDDVSAAAGTITNLCQYSTAADAAIPNDAPWLLSRPPDGFNATDYAAPDYFIDGACCPAGPSGCNPQVMRFQGLTLSVRCVEARRAHRLGCKPLPTDNRLTRSA